MVQDEGDKQERMKQQMNKQITTEVKDIRYIIADKNITFRNYTRL